MAENSIKTRKDRFGGLTLDTKTLKFTDEKEFEKELKKAIEEWRHGHVRGLWIKVRLEHSHLVPVCAGLGFDFHHAQPGYVMMNQWLCSDEPNSLPEYANHYIGVAGFVVNDKNEVLVIQERFTERKWWKFPGGHADKGEDLEDTAKREVFEETGVKCDFISLLCFRHLHQYCYGCSDIYFVCLMKPISEEINACQYEVGACQWMNIDEYLAQENSSEMNKFVVQCYKEGLLRDQLSIVPRDVLAFTRDKYNKVYSVHTSS